MRIALCNEVIAPMPFPRQCEYAAKLGYDGLEIAPYTLSEDPHRIGSAQIAAARSAAEDCGIAVTGLHWLLVKPAGLSISSKDEAVRKKTVDVMLSLIDLCAALGGKYLVHGSPQQRRVEAGETRAAAHGAREGMLCRGRRARPQGGRGVLRRAAIVRADAAHQHARGGGADRGRDLESRREDDARLQLGGPHGEGAARDAARALAAQRPDRPRPGERPQPPRPRAGRAALRPACSLR